MVNTARQQNKCARYLEALNSSANKVEETVHLHYIKIVVHDNENIKI